MPAALSLDGECFLVEDFAVNRIEFRHVLAKGKKVGGLVDRLPPAAVLLREGLHPLAG